MSIKNLTGENNVNSIIPCECGVFTPTVVNQQNIDTIDNVSITYYRCGTYYNLRVRFRVKELVLLATTSVGLLLDQWPDIVFSTDKTNAIGNWAVTNKIAYFANAFCAAGGNELKIQWTPDTVLLNGWVESTFIFNYPP